MQPCERYYGDAVSMANDSRHTINLYSLSCRKQKAQATKQPQQKVQCDSYGLLKLRHCGTSTIPVL